ncbi:MAG: hypothetical protein ACJ72D_20295 [Marmoricola sp.]
MQAPPPGYAPGYAPGYVPGYSAGPPPPGYLPTLAAAHKPGAIPLRPLKLGDIYDGAFKIIRFNPRSTVGSAVLVTAVAMAVPILITGILTATLDLSFTALDSTDPGASDTVGAYSAYGSIVTGSILQTIGLVFVTGMIVHVTAAAAVGRKLSLGGAWEATRGKRAALIGLAALLFGGTLAYLALAVGLIVLVAVTLPQVAAVLIGIALGAGSLVAMFFFWGRVYYLAVPPLMLEPVGVGGALRRSWRLTAGQFWRTVGIALLTMMITQIAGSILSTPFSVIGIVGTIAAGGNGASLLIYVVTNAVATVISAAFVAPFTSAVTSLQYLDQRIRKEGYDVELLTRAGVTGL